jgi:hypothetical protein
MPCLTTHVDHIYDCHITADIESLQRYVVSVDRHGVNMSLGVKDISYRITPSAEDVGKHLNVNITNEVCEELGCLKAQVERRTAPMVVTFGIVCTRSEIALIEVTPEDVQWIYPDMGVVYEVTSRVNWNIEY